jgi:hypothetical protein
VVDLLLNNMLMFGIVRVNNPDRLPSSLALCSIRTFNRKAAEQRRQCATLCVHTRLYQLL